MPAAPAQAKYASMIIDAQTGTILHAVNPNKRYYPASLTKMMTMYMAFEELSAGKLQLNQKLKVSKYASRQPRSKLWMEPGSTITVKDALLSLVTRSANDAAVVLAESIAGSEKKFAHRMTQTALKIGMLNTRFKNASGLPNKGQVSTARDMALLARSLMIRFPQYYHLFGTERFKFRGNTIVGHNNFVKSYQGADGLKTGFINASGYNLVASAKRDKIRLIGVVFGGLSAKWRDKHMTKLMDYGFIKADTVIASKEEKKQARLEKREQYAQQREKFFEQAREKGQTLALNRTVKAEGTVTFSKIEQPQLNAEILPIKKPAL